MDYESKKTVAILKQMVADGKITLADAEKYCPELAESEDERIVNALIGYLIGSVHDVNEVIIPGIKVSDAIAWIEKHKEQKPAEWSEKDEGMLQTVINRLELSKKRNASEIPYVEKCVEWLKSLRQRLSNVERVGKNWKPSKELLANLQAIYDYHGCDFSSDGRQGIKKLLEQLKALVEL